jgi:hypothetical protein
VFWALPIRIWAEQISERPPKGRDGSPLVMAGGAYLVHHPWLMAGAGFLANEGQGIAALTLVLIPTETAPLNYGMAAPLWIATAGALTVFCAGLSIRETAPLRSRTD